MPTISAVTRLEYLNLHLKSALLYFDQVQVYNLFEHLEKQRNSMPQRTKSEIDYLIEKQIITELPPAEQWHIGSDMKKEAQALLSEEAFSLVLVDSALENTRRVLASAEEAQLLPAKATVD